MPRALDLNPNDPLVRTAVFGVEVQDFLKGPIGDFLLKRAEQRLSVLLGKLKVTREMSQVTELQAEIRHLEGFEGWLAEAVQAGLTATQMLEGDADAEDA